MSVRYVGFFAESSGYAEAARRQLLALAGTGHPVTALSVTLETDAAFDFVMPSVDHREVRRLARRTAAEQVRLIHTPVPHFPLFRIPSCRLIGITAWELSAIPDDWRTPLDSMHEIWVPSQFCADAFVQATQRPVQVVPHPVQTVGEGPAEIPGVDPSTFLFLSTFEWSDRKNPIGLLRAFAHAFPGRRDVALFLKVGLRFQSNPKRILRTIARELGRGAFPHVYVCFDMLSPPAMKRLLRRANACVSLHRAEGFGLTLAEAMAAEKPVVATGYSGNLEFMDGDSAFLVDYRLTPVRERLTRTSLFDPRLSWAEPLHDAAVAALRACVDSPALAARVARRGWNRVSRELSSERSVGSNRHQNRIERTSRRRRTRRLASQFPADDHLSSCMARESETLPARRSGANHPGRTSRPWHLLRCCHSPSGSAPGAPRTRRQSTRHSRRTHMNRRPSPASNAYASEAL